MAEGKEKKKKAAATAAAAEDKATRMQNMTSGEMLKAGRMDRKLGLEEISSSIHIRVTQLRALEEGNIEALPGMTYALGFVRSYASFLKLLANEVVTKFKSEHGAMKPVMPELHIPEPIPENRMPDPMIIGVAAFCAVVLLLGWSIFSGGGDDDVAKVADQIPPAPVVEMAAELPPESISPATETASVPENTSMTGSNLLATTPVTGAPAPAAEKHTDYIVSMTAPVKAETQRAAKAEVETPMQVLPVKKEEKPVAKLETKAETIRAQTEEKPAEELIAVKRGKSRVTLQATEESWVQVNGPGGKVLYKKLMKKGEKFYVPDGAGYTMTTTNAGGVDVYVDGSKSQTVGKTGEIMRGVTIDAERLKRPRVKVSNY